MKEGVRPKDMLTRSELGSNIHEAGGRFYSKNIHRVIGTTPVTAVKKELPERVLGRVNHDPK